MRSHIRGCAFKATALVVLLLGGLSVPAARAQAPVELRFKPPASVAHPFARELWAEVVTPSGKTLRLPVFFRGSGLFAVRARANETGDYRLGRVTEVTAGSGGEVELTVAPESGGRATVTAVATLPQVQRDRAQPSRFILGSGQPYTPIGANVAWGDATGPAFIVRALADFQRQDLNWMRVWMANWGGLDLTWVPNGGSPPPGTLDQRVAADWDRLIEAAEAKGVYLQIVLQHHGQYSTRVNPNWPQNPYNAAQPGGFLQTPGEFFTSPVARGLTALKYRYIVARWGYSPAVLAWELFNEVHWVDPINIGHDDATVAAWHQEMAAVLRQYDPYQHLVTTSTENLRSPIYAAMDYFQPHLYAANIIAGARNFSVAPAQLDRPIFYGEFGDDNMALSAAQADSGVAIVPPVWASVLGEGRYPAQLWVGQKLLATGRIGELGAMARFLAATELCQRDRLVPFSPAVDCSTRTPFALRAGQAWQRRPSPEITVSLDGRESLEFADIPRNYVGNAAGRADGYPDRATYHLDLPWEQFVTARVTDVGANGSAIRISVDGMVVQEKVWPAKAADAPSANKPVLLPFNLPAGQHTLVVQNPGAPDWFQLEALEFSADIPVLAAIGRRNADFIALWLWHREGVFAVKAPAAVTGTVQLEEVPAGTWQVTWWDTFKGVASTPVQIVHPGGRLQLPTPAINRHAAVVLTR